LASSSWYWFGYSEVNTNQDSKFGNYSAYSAAVDQLAQNAPNYLGIWAAGNDVSNARRFNQLITLNTVFQPACLMQQTDFIR
jgi:hypothetical protein